MSERPWRTQVHVLGVGQHLVSVELPARSDRAVILKRADIPAEIMMGMYVGKRLHARVNFGTEHDEDLTFTDWEPR